MNKKEHMCYIVVFKNKKVVFMRTEPKKSKDILAVGIGNTDYMLNELNLYIASIKYQKARQYVRKISMESEE